MPINATIEVFKTNVQDSFQAQQLISILLHHFPGSKVSIDMKDCDKVLRIEGACTADKTISLLQENGFSCTELL
ncbi:hypothetical protein ACTHGU_02240 [Chitinophagaceae bacterium MMS25-I14]